MSGILKVGDKCTGHGGFPPRKAITGSPDVFVNGKPVHRVGDLWEEHSKGSSHHNGTLIEGSSTVKVNGLPVGRIGDSISCGSKAAGGTPSDTFCG